MNNNYPILHSLVELAEKLSIRVVFKNLKDDEFAINSGMCSLKGDTLIIIDSRSSLQEKVNALIRELKKFNLDSIFITPALREILEDQDVPF